MMDIEPRNQNLTQIAIDRIWETIPPVWSMIRSHLRSIATERFEISVEQFHILRHIRKGINTVSELAANRGISRPAVSQAVDILVEKGLISRQQDPDDRRHVILRLTSAGDDLLNCVFQENRTWLTHQLELCDNEELGRIVDAMDILRGLLVK